MSPAHLYKYGRINRQCEERAEKLFTTPQLWFSSPADLNDPFECRPQITCGGSREDVINFLVKMIRRNLPYLSEDSVTAEATAIYLSGSHRHPETWVTVRQSIVDDLAQRIALCCFSEVNDDILMWSHYADMHHGYCLKFAATDETPFFGEAQQVTYSASLPVVDIVDDSANDKAAKVLLTKCIDWKYEREWRIVNYKSGVGPHEYPAELLVGVIFGARMPAGDRAKIRGWLGRRRHPVGVYEALQSDRDFRVEIQRVE